jgi:hypothetical protein
METWNTVKTLKDIAGAYQSIYEAKKQVDQDEDGDNDFADNMIARMVASGMSREEAIKKVKNKEYNKEEYSLDEETKAEKEARIAARRARVKQMEDEGAVMTSSRRASEVAKQRKEAKKAEALERAGSSILNQMRGASGRVSERPMGSEAPKAKEKAPEATRRLNPNLRKDNLGSAADRVLKSMKKEELELWVNELIEEGYDLSEYTWDEMAEIYLDEATRMGKELGKEGEIATRKELAARSNAHQRSGSVDKTIAAAERRADRPYIKPVRDESKSDYNKRLQKSSDTMSKLAASRRGSVRDKPRAGLRGYGADVKGSDKELQNSRRSAMAAGTLTPREKKMLNKEAYETYEFVASYLLENNFAESVEDANAIINNMSEGWFESIMEEKKPLPVAKMKRKEEKLDKELGSEMSKVLRTEIDSPERKELLRKNRRFGDMHDVRRSVSTRGGKRPLPMPEVGRYKPKDED